jgi:DNA repair photolyase
MPGPRQVSLFPEAQAPTLRDVADAVRAAGLDGLPDAARRADQARYQEVIVRSALTRTDGMPFDWALNPYRGCTHACEYCYARKYQRHLELGAGDDFSGLILVKTNLADALRREVSRSSWPRTLVAVGTATDPYQPIEGHYRLTRRCLEVLTASRTPFTVVTKGPLALRDLDVFLEATRGAGCQVMMSVPSVDEAVWRTLEPGTAPPAQRLRAIGAIARAGVDAGVLMMPLLPGISTSPAGLERTLAAIADSGARLAGSCVARLDPGVREHFVGVLARRYPELVDGYDRLYRTAHAASGYAHAVKDLVRRTWRRVAARRRGGEDQPRPCSAMSAETRASVGGCVEKSDAMPRPDSGFTMNM